MKNVLILRTKKSAKHVLTTLLAIILRIITPKQMINRFRSKGHTLSLMMDPRNRQPDINAQSADIIQTLINYLEEHVAGIVAIKCLTNKQIAEKTLPIIERKSSLYIFGEGW